MEYLYHFTPRRFESEEQVISVVTSILRNGFFFSEEPLKVDWKDVYAVGRQRELFLMQLRFCLTAITSLSELITHAEKFGLIGFEFEENFIVKIGGFPVFYVPSPQAENSSIEEYKGISLLYRLGDVQEILEYIVRYNLIQTPIDIENALGAIKFLANVCYPTKRRLKTLDSTQINYYNQREWRVIHGLTSNELQIGYHENHFTINAFESNPIRNFITRVLIFKNKNVSEEVCQRIFRKIEMLMMNFNMKCELKLIPTNSY